MASTLVTGPTDSICDVSGVLVGHDHRIDDHVTVGTMTKRGVGWASGTTVIRLPSGAVAGVDVRGGGPGTRETDLLAPHNSVQCANAIVLTGGSAFGLSAADGVMAAAEASGAGLPMNLRGNVVPIVPAAVIYDLPVGAWDARPTAEFGWRAYKSASDTPEWGSVGAGAGARTARLKGGVGSASVTIKKGPASGVTVGASVVVNPVGEVFGPDGAPWDDDVTEHFGLRRPTSIDAAALASLPDKSAGLNTCVGVVATDAALDCASVTRVAMAAHDGLARAIRPSHTPADGDTLFAVATGTARTKSSLVPPGMNPQLPVVAAVGAAAAVVVARAVLAGVLAAQSVAGIPTARSVLPSMVE